MAVQPFAGQNVRNLIPVTDPRTHEILGYRDGAGRQWTPDGKPSPDLPSGGYGGYQHGTDTSHQNATALATHSETEAHQKARLLATDKDRIAAEAAARGAVNELDSQLGQIWVDGKEAHVTGRDAKGNLLISVGGGKSAPMSTALGTLTAFNALNQTAIDPNTQFVMSVGAQRRADGSVMTERGGAFSDSQVGSAPLQGQNRMTIGSALNFLASLSTKDKGAFQVVVDQLHQAGYLSDQDYVNSGSSYNAAIGTAYSRVALDVAALNSTEGGANTGLDTYLADRAAHPPQGSSYKPVTRNYTDPNEIRAAAESAAMAAIGRRLTPQEQAAMTAHFHGQEASNYDAIDAAGRAGTGATVTSPSVSGSAYAEINDNPQLAQEQANFDMLKYGDMIKSLMGVQ